MTFCDSSSLRNFLQKRSWCSDQWGDLARVVWEVCSKTNCLPSPYPLRNHRVSVSATFLLCFISPFHFSLFSQAHSCPLHSLLLLASWSTWLRCPAANLCPLIFHGFPFAPSITLTVVTAVDHHSNSAVVLGWTCNKWVIITPAEAICMWKWEEGFGRALGRYFVYRVDRSWYDRLGRSCSSRAKLMQLIPTLWSLQQAAFALCSFCCIAFAVSPLPPVPCQAQLVSVICDPLKIIWETVVPQSRTQTSDAVTWASEPHASPISTTHGREKRVVRKESSPQNQNLCAVWKGSVNAAAARTFVCFSCDENGDLSHNTCVFPSRESQNHLWYGENDAWL